MTLQELMEKRANIIAQARQIVDKAEKEKREMTEEEQRNFDKAMDDAAKMKADVERLQLLEEEERQLAQSAGQPVHQQMQPGVENRESDEIKELRKRFPKQDDAWMRDQAKRSANFERALTAFITRDGQPHEQRALQQDLDIYGGYLVPPVTFAAGMIQAVDNLVYMRQLATKYEVMNAKSLGIVALDNDPADPTWTAELSIGTADSTMSFGMRELFPHPLTQNILISRKLIREVSSIIGLVQQRLAYKNSVVQENAFLNGDGSNEPLGLFTASAHGINTDRDVSTGNTTTSIAFDGLKEAKYGLKPQYRNRPSTRWIFHTDGIKQIAKLKDGNAQYIWAESVRVGEPDRIMGIPVIESLYAPSTFTTGLYVGILGDMQQYAIADALMMEMYTIQELYAATYQVAIVLRSESDGMPILSEAFIRVKLA